MDRIGVVAGVDRPVGDGAVVAWGGLTDRRWTVPVACTLALPALWPAGLAVLAAVWPIQQRRPELAPRRAPGFRAALLGAGSAALASSVPTPAPLVEDSSGPHGHG